MEESHRHCAKWKKPRTKEYILYDSIYMDPCIELKAVVFMVRGLGGILTGKGQKEASGC